MQMRIYVLYDEKVSAYNVPFFAPTDGSATRSFQDLANDLNTNVGRHPSDFSLYCIGVYDDASASIENFAPRVFLCKASALVQPHEPMLFERNA